MRNIFSRVGLYNIFTNYDNDGGLEDHAFVYSPTRAKQLPCGHGTGILKYRYNKQYTTGELILECKDLFCDSTVNAIVQPK
jgi:hypothetical protein